MVNAENEVTTAVSNEAPTVTQVVEISTVSGQNPTMSVDAHASVEVAANGSSEVVDAIQMNGVSVHSEDVNGDHDENDNNDDEEDTEDSSDDDAVSRVGSESWQATGVPSGLLLRVEEMLSDGHSPHEIFRQLFPSMNLDVSQYSDSAVIGILSDILERPPTREKLSQYNTLQDAIELFRTRRRILILTGAGVSVSCGIPDFRSKDGIYARLHVDFPDLPDPTAMFDIRYFRHNPAPFYDFAKEIFPGQFTPSVSHRFIKELEDNDKLLRNYTQNIDTLEHQTGITRVIECHGSFSKATCTKCGEKFDGDVIKEDVLNKRVALCTVCKEGVIKPDIVFFGEDLGQDFHRQMAEDKHDVDLLVVIGSSLKVRPVSLIPFSVNKDVPQILINREPLASYRADIELLGNCDDIIREICMALGGSFSKMIDDYDKKEGEDGVEAESDANAAGAEKESNKRKRRLIEMDEFQQLMENEAQPKNGSGVEENENDEVDGVETKKRRLEGDGGEEEQVAEKPTAVTSSDAVSGMTGMFEMRYVNIETKLPPNTCAQVTRNQTVFPGAEIMFDLDAKVVCRAPVRRPGPNGAMSNGYSSDDDDSCGESCSDACCGENQQLVRSTSVDNLVTDVGNVACEDIADAISSSDTCPPFLMYEGSDVMSATDFRDMCNDIVNEAEDA